VETSLYQESLEGKIQIGQYLLAVDLSCSAGGSTMARTEDPVSKQKNKMHKRGLIKV